MSELLLGIGVWFGVSLVAVFMFALGAALGRRGAWEEGYRLGLQVGEARAEQRLREKEHQREAGDGGRRRKAG